MQSKSKFDKIMTLILVALCVVLLSATVIKMYSPREVHEFTSSQDVSKVNVSVSEAVKGTFIKESTFQGEVFSPTADVALHADTAGTVKRILTERGDVVNEGDIVAYVDASRPGTNYTESPVRATVSGEVLSVDTTLGAEVTTTTSILTIRPEKELRVKTNIPERYLGSITYGLEGKVTSIAYDGVSFPVEITYISPVVNANNRTNEIELTFKSSHEGIKEGMFVTISLVTEMEDDVLMIPSSAVETYAGENVVYTVEDGMAKRVSVETGKTNGSSVVILSGLSEGDKVVVSGNVSDGTEVEIV